MQRPDAYPFLGRKRRKCRVASPQTLHVFRCWCCDTQVMLCSGCDRGQRYDSKACRAPPGHAATGHNERSANWNEPARVPRLALDAALGRHPLSLGFSWRKNAPPLLAATARAACPAHRKAGRRAAKSRDTADRIGAHTQKPSDGASPVSHPMQSYQPLKTMHVGALRAHGFPRDKHPARDPAPAVAKLPVFKQARLSPIDAAQDHIARAYRAHIARSERAVIEAPCDASSRTGAGPRRLRRFIDVAAARTVRI